MRLSIEIGGMRCDRCIVAIDVALRAVNGVTGCDATLTGAIVEFDHAAASRDSLFQAIRGAGAYEITGLDVGD